MFFIIIVIVVVVVVVFVFVVVFTMRALSIRYVIKQDYVHFSVDALLIFRRVKKETLLTLHDIRVAIIVLG